MRFAGPSAWAEGRFQAQGGGDGRLPVGGPKRLLPIYTGAECGEFMREERLVNPRQPFGRRLNRKWVRQMRKLEIRPGPVPGLLDLPARTGLRST